jgi:hypothetical protein
MRKRRTFLPLWGVGFESAGREDIGQRLLGAMLDNAFPPWNHGFFPAALSPRAAGQPDDRLLIAIRISY